APMQLWQLDIMGGVFLAGGHEYKTLPAPVTADRAAKLTGARTTHQPLPPPGTTTGGMRGERTMTRESLCFLPRHHRSTQACHFQWRHFQPLKQCAGI